ncbi:MAG: FAD-dependent oxidoreductase [Chloroflexi bacterium]|nr:MAG: FAD-dependent oxidoreductase [Chloroflexota bacterium]
MTAEPPPRFVDLPNSLVPVTSAVDVLIVGGGSAGFSAAVAAARNGAEVLLLERFSYIGGLATGGLIILLLTMDDGAGRQAVGGLCQEIVGRMERRNAVYYPPREQWNDPDSKLIDHYSQWGLVWGSPAPGGHRVRYSVAFDAHEFIYAADQMLKEAGVRVLYQTWACEPVVDNGSVKAIVIQNKAGRQAIATKVVIDATGDGDIFAGAGESFELERVHPWLWFELANVEAAAVPGRGLFFHTPGGGRVLVPWGGEARVDLQHPVPKPATALPR